MLHWIRKIMFYILLAHAFFYAIRWYGWYPRTQRFHYKSCLPYSNLTQRGHEVLILNVQSYIFKFHFLHLIDIIADFTLKDKCFANIFHSFFWINVKYLHANYSPCEIWILSAHYLTSKLFTCKLIDFLFISNSGRKWKIHLTMIKSKQNPLKYGKTALF